MASVKKIDSRHQKQALLEEGGRSYLAAATALLEFRREVQTRCRQVLEERFEEFADAVGVSLDRRNISECGTKEGEWDGLYADLGAKSGAIRVTAEFYGEFYCYLWWDADDHEPPAVSVCAEMWLNRQKWAEVLYTALRKAGGKDVEQENNCVWMSHPLEPGEMGSFEQKLDDLLGTWIRLCRLCHGIKGVLSKQG